MISYTFQFIHASMPCACTCTLHTHHNNRFHLAIEIRDSEIKDSKSRDRTFRTRNSSSVAVSTRRLSLVTPHLSLVACCVVHLHTHPPLLYMHACVCMQHSYMLYACTHWRERKNTDIRIQKHRGAAEYD